MAKRQAVWILWTDASHTMPNLQASAKEYMEQGDPGVKLNTIGWLVGRKNGFHIISPEYCEEDEDFRGFHAIPDSCIIRKKVLK